MTTTKKRHALCKAYRDEQKTYEPACDTLRKARKLMAISRERLAARMGIPEIILEKYENGAIRIPNSVMLKIFMFGLDFWCEQDL